VPGDSPPSRKPSPLAGLARHTQHRTVRAGGSHPPPWVCVPMVEGMRVSWSNDSFKFFSVTASELFLCELERTGQLKVMLIDVPSAFPAVFHFSFLSHFIILLLFLNFKLPNITPAVFRPAPALEQDCAQGDEWAPPAQTRRLPGGSSSPRRFSFSCLGGVRSLVLGNPPRGVCRYAIPHPSEPRHERPALQGPWPVLGAVVCARCLCACGANAACPVQTARSGPGLASGIGPSRWPRTDGAAGSLPAPFPLGAARFLPRTPACGSRSAGRGRAVAFTEAFVTVTGRSLSLNKPWRAGEPAEGVLPLSVPQTALVALPAEQTPAPPQGRVQCLQHLPEPRAGVRLPEESGDRGEDQQDTMAPAAERSLFPALHQRYVAVAAGTGQARTSAAASRLAAGHGPLCGAAWGQTRVNEMAAAFGASRGAGAWPELSGRARFRARGSVLISQPPFPAREGVFSPG